jgi:hypothetical protein
MVLNPNGIEPTFLKLDSWSPGAGFIHIITSNVLEQGRCEHRISEGGGGGKIFLLHKNKMEDWIKISYFNTNYVKYCL